MKNMIVRKLSLGLIALSAIFGLMAVSGCDQGSGSGSFGARIGLVPPPISVTFRESLWWNGYVLQLHNRSNTRVVAHVYVENKRDNQSTSVSVGIAPNEYKELGVLEMNWSFVPGETGHISADGFTQNIYFEIEEGGRYRTW